MSALADAFAPYIGFSRVGFVNILAFRLRYFTGIITYALNVTVYYFIWSAVYRSGQSIAGYNLAQMITYVSVGWIIRSFYTNTIDQEMAYEMIEGKIAMNLIKPVSVQWMWICRAIGESAFRLGLLTLPTAIVISFVFHVQAPASRDGFSAFSARGSRQFFPDGCNQFHDRDLRDSAQIDPGADPRQVLAHRAAFRTADPHVLFSRIRCARYSRGCPSSTSPTLRCKFIWVKLDRRGRSTRLGHAMGLGFRSAASSATFGGRGPRVAVITIQGG